MTPVALEHRADARSPVYPLTSISIFQGITYITDSSPQVWFRVGNGAWQLTDGWGTGISAFGSADGGIAVAGSTNDFRTCSVTITGTGNPSMGSWTSRPGKLIVKTGGNRQGNVWFMTSDKKLLAWTQVDPVTVGAVDFAIRDMVYVVLGNDVCARSLEVNILDRICITPPFSPLLIASSDSNLYVVSADGVLFSTVLPFTTSSVFFDTGFRAPKMRFLTVPLDGYEPILIDGSGGIRSGFCNVAGGVRCFAAPAVSSVAASVPAVVDPPLQTSAGLEEVRNQENPVTVLVAPATVTNTVSVRVVGPSLAVPVPPKPSTTFASVGDGASGGERGSVVGVVAGIVVCLFLGLLVGIVVVGWRRRARNSVEVGGLGGRRRRLSGQGLRGWGMEVREGVVQKVEDRHMRILVPERSYHGYAPRPFDGYGGDAEGIPVEMVPRHAEFIQQPYRQHSPVVEENRYQRYVNSPVPGQFRQQSPVVEENRQWPRVQTPVSGYIWQPLISAELGQQSDMERQNVPARATHSSPQLQPMTPQTLCREQEPFAQPEVQAPQEQQTQQVLSKHCDIKQPVVIPPRNVSQLTASGSVSKKHFRKKPNLGVKQPVVNVKEVFTTSVPVTPVVDNDFVGGDELPMYREAAFGTVQRPAWDVKEM
ncbi:hypothetical protein HDU97_008801 [Phlyctochytrium planicorne]|nr:hypothetical protein HDU97_008801 [Phlyctochytrium planicorne]